MTNRNFLLLCILPLVYAAYIFYPRWQKPNTEATLAWDVSGYYWYLPAIFIYQDVKEQKWAGRILEKYGPSGRELQQAFLHPSGHYVMKYSAGMAVMYFPFFIVAHLLAGPLGYPADGFSAPYQFAIQTGGLLVAILGLWLLQLFLLKFFKRSTVHICLLLLVIGTNYLNYAAIDVGMPHSWLFTLYVVFLWLTWLFHKKPGWGYAFALGAVYGLMVLTRPTEIITALIPLLWGVESFSAAAFRKKWLFLSSHIKYIFMMACCAALVFSLQLCYWKYASGEWIVYSYQQQGFDWKNPHFRSYLISVRNGWLAYNPLMLFALLGFIPLWKYHKTFRIAALVFFLLFLYIVCSWEFYWYGGRFMVQSYPVLCLALAAFIEWISRRMVTKILFIPVFLAAAYIGLWTNIQYHHGDLYDFYTSNRKYYLATVGRWKVPEETYKLRDTDELFTGTPEDPERLYYNNFEQDHMTECSGYPVISGAASSCLNEQVTGREYPFPCADSALRNKTWLRAEAVFACTQKEWDVWNMPQFIVSFFNGKEMVKTRMIRISRFLPEGATRKLYVDVRIPRESFDTIQVSIWQPEYRHVLIFDELQVTAFD